MSLLQLNFEPFPIIYTERLVLREVSVNDVAELFIQRSHPEIQKFIKREPAQSIEEAFQFIHKIAVQQKNQQCITWAITLKEYHKLIGTVCFWNIDPVLGTLEIGYSLHPDYFKKGIMSEAIQPIISYGFNQMLSKRIDAFTNKLNAASITMLYKQGFKRNLDYEAIYTPKAELEYNQIYSLLKNNT